MRHYAIRTYANAIVEIGMRSQPVTSTWGADALTGVAYGALGFPGIMLLFIGGLILARIMQGMLADVV